LDFFYRAHFEAAPAVVLVLAAGWYAWAVRRLHRRQRAWPRSRTACFVGAWLLVAVASFSGLTAFSSTNFTAYGSLYIMVGLAAPLLLAYSAPAALALQGAPARARLLETRPARILANPLITWTAFTATVFVVFFTGVVPATVGGGGAEQALFLWLVAVGWLFFWPAVDVDPIPRRISYWPRILYMLMAFPVFAILGQGLESQSARIARGISPGSLHLGGAIIWVAGEVASLGGVMSVFAQWLRADERRVRTHEQGNDAAAARQLALWRASRDAATRAASR
jgi:cytochrome c oxidase assembly factor CtaG